MLVEQILASTASTHPTRYLWDLLEASEKFREARVACKQLRRNLRLKNQNLSAVQGGALIHFLVDHPETCNQIVSFGRVQPDARALAKDDRQSSKHRVNRILPITKRWWQSIAPVIAQEEEMDYAPGLVEFHLSELRFESFMSCPNDVIECRSTDPSHRPIILYSDMPFYLPKYSDQWFRDPDDREMLRHRPVIVQYVTNRREEAQVFAQRLQGVANSIRIVYERDEELIKRELAECELWSFWLCRCQSGDHWTIGDEHFRNDCKEHEEGKES